MDANEDPVCRSGWYDEDGIGNESEAAALDRLKAKNVELLAALIVAEKKLRDYNMCVEHEWGNCRSSEEMESDHAWAPEIYEVRAAIAKAETQHTP